MIKRIELVNFMSHERTVVEPASGLTVLVGPNNCGKSAFVSALQILCQNAKSNYVMRHGEKKCQIIVETSDGHTVQWSRAKSGSPQYRIDGEKFDRLRGGVPEKLHQILRLDQVVCDKDEFDIHFGEQKSPVFLINDSGKAAAQFFASSSDAIRLVQMQETHKTRVRDFKRDLKTATEELTEIEHSLELLQPTTNIDHLISECEKEFQSLKERDEEIAEAEILINGIRALTARLNFRDETAATLADLTTPPTLADEKPLVELTQSYRRSKIAWSKSEEIYEALRHLEVTPVIEDTSTLEHLAVEIRRHEALNQKYESVVDVIDPLDPPPKLSNIDMALVKQLKELENSHDQLNQQHQALKQVDRPPTMKPWSDLFETLQGIRTQCMLEAEQAEKLAAIEKDANQVLNRFKDWVNANPTCPTCGAETSSQRLIRQIETERQK